MRHRFLGSLGALGLMLAMLWLPSAAQAFDCDSVVFDDTHMLSPSDVKLVEAAAGKIENLGGVVRVRMFKDNGASGGLEVLIQKMIIPACPSWQAMDHSPRTNLVIIAIGMNPHEQMLRMGDQFVRAFSNAQDARIRGDVMGPRLRNGDFAGALVGGLNEFAKIIDAYEHPAPVQPSGGTTTI